MSGAEVPKFRTGDYVIRAGRPAIIERGIVRDAIPISTGLVNHWWVYWEVTELKIEHESDLILDPDPGP
ncbi:hypothetical protein J8F10_10220 [Gemmata sp. G18]|uniref:Uncharacterized protein n=1 Tax=Gemmata palustris TaxID=2822762 RepID=A0ABS5BQS3_9BACT|nr:hypothetical protein [Gemmata palustris]MBP3955655.1 hypothetical protein [Gemmata palustris]